MKKCPFIAEWESFSYETGEPLIRELYPEDVLPYLESATSYQDIATRLNAPVESVQHVVNQIHYMLLWRSEQ